MEKPNPQDNSYNIHYRFEKTETVQYSVEMQILNLISKKTGACPLLKDTVNQHSGRFESN